MVAVSVDLTAGLRMTFIVRVSLDESGQLRGIVEQVKTGRKQQFDSADAICRIIERPVEAEHERPPGR